MIAVIRVVLARLVGDQDGNGLVLMPAGVLVLFFLGSLAADTSVTWRAQQALESEAAGLANDAASAVDQVDWFSGESAVPSAALVGDIISRSDRCTGGLVAGSTPPAVTVTCADTFDYLFRQGTFGASATATADLQDG